MSDPRFPHVRSRLNAAVLLASLGLGLIIALGDYNLALFLEINGLHPYTPDFLLAALTILGDTRILLASLLLLFWRHRHCAWAYMLILVPGGVLVQGLKRYVEFDRPPEVLDPMLIHVVGEPLKHHSFPSGHTASLFALAAIIVSSSLPASLRVSILLLASVSAISRISVGAHWPVDVASGAFIGYIIGLAGIYLYRYCRKITLKRHAEAILWLVIVVIAGSIFFQQDTDYPAVEWLGFAYVGLCLGVGLLFFPRNPASGVHA